ncbi:MAG: sugar phosphate nucleotidyltransferase [Clostridium sp.]|uniref:sugar phosphate nucleotidyltransferase n=1 Tax=Clostridium sp. TaxID=1506 RepID=UPI0039ECFA80
MKAIIMAGGKGTRLRPLTCNRPKPMMPIMGKPVMQYSLELLKNSGIKDIGITLQYLPDSIIDYFGDGSEFGVNLKYFIEASPLGTAGSVKNAEDFLDETFIVISGDAVTDVNLIEALKYHKDKKAVATLILKEVSAPLEYGVVVTDKEGKITGFLEKPNWREVFSDKVNTGIYVLEPEIFKFYPMTSRCNTPPSKDGDNSDTSLDNSSKLGGSTKSHQVRFIDDRDKSFDFSNDLFPILMKKNVSMYGYNSNFYWCDIGNINQFMQCNYDVLMGRVNVNIKGEEYKKGIWIGNNCTLSPNVNIKPPVYIGDNSNVYDGVEIGPYTVIGKNNIISSGSTIKKSIIFNNSYIGENTEIRASLICDKAQLENGVSMFEEAVIGDESIIGERAIIKPKVKIWPNKSIGNGEVIRENLIWNRKIERSFFSSKGVRGNINVNITPEFVLKLSSAYGSILNSNSKIIISCSDEGSAQMLKFSLATGLISMGIQVYDLNKSTLEATRIITASRGFSGAVHIYVNKDNSERAVIVFIDKDGLDISKNMKRKIESNFVREDFRRVKMDNFKSIVTMEDCTKHYIKNILDKLNREKIINNKYKMVFMTKNRIIKWQLINMFNEIKVDTVVMKDSSDLGQLSEEVKKSHASLGIWISDEADNYVLIDEKGKIMENSFKDVLKALVILNTFKFKTLAVAVDVTHSVEKIANMYNAKFIITKIDHRNIVSEYIKNEKDKNEKEILVSYLSTIDAVSMLSLILNLMAEFNMTLSGLTETVPQYHNKVMKVKCPWEMKGKVMRNIIENGGFNYLDSIEGVRISFPKCWVIILPDLDEPLCSVQAEGEDEEYVEKILKKIYFNIQKILC